MSIKKIGTADLPEKIKEYFAKQIEWNKKSGNMLLKNLQTLLMTGLTIHFTVYFGDDDMFWGHSVVVYGDVENGPNEAQSDEKVFHLDQADHYPRSE